MAAGDGPGSDSQLVVPPAFIALFVPPGRLKPTESREHIATRHEFCEDLAQSLVEMARTQRWSLGITTDDALERIRRGLATLELSDGERGWVIGRLGELIHER
jgi:hypothetical protein